MTEKNFNTEATNVDVTKDAIPSKKSNVFTVFLVIAISIAVLGFVCFISFILPTFFEAEKEDATVSDSLITLNEYNRLKAGMTHTEVYDIVGSFGMKKSETGSARDDYHIVMYQYDGYGEAGANAQLMFINGELDTMAQYGLKNYYGAKEIEEINPAKKLESKISINDYDFSFEVSGPNTIGSYKLITTFKNKSDYTTTSILIDVSVNNDTSTLLASHEEILKPQQTSSQFDTTTCQNPIDSYKIIKYYINFIADDNKEYTYCYDFSTGDCLVYRAH